MNIIHIPSRDMISRLPSSIIGNILMCLPLKEAARTSVLSKSWRYEWGTLPQLVFDAADTPNTEEGRGNVLLMIYSTLFHHPAGSIFKCSINNCGLISSSDMDNIIQILSSKGIRDLALCVSDDDEPPLLSRYIFSCSQLQHLSLRTFVIMPPPTFNEFSQLISLELIDVEFLTDNEPSPNITISGCPLLERFSLECLTSIDCFAINAPNLKLFHFKGVIKRVVTFNTPLLRVFSLSQYNDIFDTSQFDLLKVFRGLPLLENLHICFTLLKILDYAEKREQRIDLLQNLKLLELINMCMMEIEEMPELFSLITNFPLMKILKLQINDWPDYGEHEDLLGYVEKLKYSDYFLNDLCEVEMQGVMGTGPELMLIKYLLAVSPALEKMHIIPRSAGTINTGSGMLCELLPRFHRASHKAQVIIHEPLANN